MILNRYANNTFIIKEITQQIDLDALNLLITKFLNNRNELEVGAEVVRAHRNYSYVIICGYASLTKDVLEELLEIFLTSYNIKFKKDSLTLEEYELLNPILPVLSARKGDQHGGRSNDTPVIDPYAQTLSNALNTYPGIKTFSSCEGHFGAVNEANFYILFTADKIENLNVLSKALWNGLEIVYEKYKINQPQLMFDYGDWPSIMSTYFEIRVNYRVGGQIELFEAMDYLANLLTRKD